MTTQQARFLLRLENRGVYCMVASPTPTPPARSDVRLAPRQDLSAILGNVPGAIVEPVIAIAPGMDTSAHPTLAEYLAELDAIATGRSGS